MCIEYRLNVKNTTGISRELSNKTLKGNPVFSLDYISVQ